MKKVTCKQGNIVVYHGGPWNGLKGKLRGEGTLTFSVEGHGAGHYTRKSDRIFTWIPK